MTPQTLRAIIGDDLLLRDMLDDALRGRQGERTDLVDNINKVDRPDGTSKDRALRKLPTGAPELHERVLAGELTPHAAMVQAGFRHRTDTDTDELPKDRTLRVRVNDGPVFSARPELGNRDFYWVGEYVDELNRAR
ncbi:hypothetical protein ACLQ3K_02355 [Tsukamurella sp. DT100]|uniref:hypothetical protein n=1 Tax=Tsukamurella sp. DT100 TaxID=3393415 RepID=UPI003CF8DFB1